MDKLLQTTFTPRFQNTLLINFSILSFYLIPFFLVFWLNAKKNIYIQKKYVVSFLISIILIMLLIAVGFDYLTYTKAGGGFFLKISHLSWEKVPCEMSKVIKFIIEYQIAIFF